MSATFASYPSWNNLSSTDSLTYEELFATPLDITDVDDMCELTSSSDAVQPAESFPSSEFVAEQPQTQARLSDLTCGVCGASAIGYNFDRITCESCKAFFRRNALRHMPNLKCRFHGCCVIDVDTRRLCTYCRLKKCFDIGMRKDWIRTEEETRLRQLQKSLKEERKRSKCIDNTVPLTALPLVVRKKQRLLGKSPEAIPTILVGAYLGRHFQLSAEDQTWLDNIDHAYESAANRADRLRLNRYTESTSLIDFIDNERTIHQSLIEFYKEIPEFAALELDQQVALIKSNLLNVIHVHDILIQGFREHPIIGVLMSRWISADFHKQMSRARQSLYRFADHPLILKLALVIFLFNVYECDDYVCKGNVQKIQDVYTELLWRYLHCLYGEREARGAIGVLTKGILHFRSLMDVMEEAVRREPSNHISDQLMQSVFRLT